MTFYFKLKDDGLIYSYTTTYRPESVKVHTTFNRKFINENLGNLKYINGSFFQRTSKPDFTQELFEIQDWFLRTDYIPNKIITGEWLDTDERWLNYLSERNTKRQRQDEINLIMQEEDTWTIVQEPVLEKTSEKE